MLTLSSSCASKLVTACATPGFKKGPSRTWDGRAGMPEPLTPTAAGQVVPLAGTRPWAISQWAYTFDRGPDLALRYLEIR